MTKKLQAFALIASLAMVALIASCADKNDTSENAPPEGNIADTAGDSETNDEYSMAEDRLKIPDNIEDEDMNGMNFRIGVRDNWYYNEVFIEDETGENVDDAIYRRNKKVEERFNINIIPLKSADPQAEALKAVKAGDDSMDLVVTHMLLLAGSSLSNPYLDWMEIPTIDLSRQWFLQDAVRKMSVNNRLFVVPGEFCMSILENSYCMYFNKSLLRDYGLEDPYRLVLDGKWTIDKLNEITRGIYQDFDNDGKKSAGDFYGLATNYHSSSITYTYSSGMRIMQNNADGIPEHIVPNEKLFANFQKVYDLLINNPGAFAGTWGEDNAMYEDNRAIFWNNMFDRTKVLRKMEEDFGIVPYPKYDEAQYSYYTMADGGASMTAIPITVKDPNKAGKIISALNAESWKTVIPEYYDIALKIKFTRDDESARVLDMLLDGRIFDFGFIYDSWIGYALYMQDLLAAKNNGIASWFDKRKNVAEKNLEKVLGSFEGYED